ncbi:CU044_2847 family protein [Pannus brasiliensis CCIBt3594]|uniref:CU044_2847 family protein n=1 Tax=Pannus brasiliensis CCIBt3594 TaxID=1427578 RepID=A0AAW9R0K2_9CHRO
MGDRSEVIPVKVNENVTVLVETRDLGGEEEVSGNLFDFQDVADTIEAITQSIAATIEKVKPKKATVEFGVEVAVKSGKLTALIVEGQGKGNLKITLEWGG